MKAQPEISIIMANYNGGRYLAEAIQSIQRQTATSWELLFVDDASDDDSVERAESLARHDPRIRVLRLPVNGGPAAARNRALPELSGRWMAVCDSDDRMMPERLERLLTRASVDGSEIVADNLLLFYAAQRTRAFLPRSFASVPRWITLEDFIDSNRLYARVPDLGYLKPMICTRLLRRTAITYDERLRIGEDYEFMARLLASGARLRLEPSPLYLYRRHPHSASYRISTAQIRALLDADRRFVRTVRPLNRREARALGRRTRSLHSLLLFDSVVHAVKQACYARAAATIFTTPRVWPLLARAALAHLCGMIAARRRSHLASLDAKAALLS